MRKVYVLYILAVCLISLESFAQQNVFNRSDANTGDWGSGNNPWFYETDNTNRGDPDFNMTPNFIRIGHNNFTSMNLNTRSYRARWVIFEAGATANRTIGGDFLDLRPNNGDCKIENLSTGSHTFTNSIALFAPTELNPIDGDLTFNSNIFNNGNFIDVYGNNGNELIINGVISGTGGLALKQNSTVRFFGDQTYTGGTFVEAGTLRLEGSASTNTITSDITISGGVLEYANGNDEQINNSSSVTISSGSWDLGIRSETINALIMTGGTLSKGSNNLIINSSSNIQNASIVVSSGSALIRFNGPLELGGTTNIDYTTSGTGNQVFRITSGLTVTSGVTNFDNSGGGSPFINLNSTNQTLDVASGATLDSEWGFRVGGLTKAGDGTLVLRAASTYNDPTVLEAGEIQFETDNAIDDDSDLVLDGGTLNANGFSDDLAQLDVNANSTIILGTGNHTLQFQNSSSVSWDGSATLTIENWQGTTGLSGTEGKIFVGNDDTGLTPAQLAQISFDNYPSPAELLPTGELVPSALDVTIFDTFNRTGSDNVGQPSSGGANWTETEGAATGARILNSALRLQRGAAGRDFVSYNMSALYETAYDGSTTNTEWRFNIRTNRSTPSGFDSGDYGVAYALGSNESDFLSASAFGYAVVIGESGPDPVRLVKFTNGLDLNSNLTTIASVSGNPPDSHFSIVVTYESCSNTWSLTARDDGGAFANPTTGNFPAAVTGVDNDFTSIDLNFMGALWNHGTDGSSFAEFDNFYIPNTVFDSEYVWNGSVDSDYQDPANWTPNRDCPRGRDRLVFNGSGNVEVTNVPDQERIGQWILGFTIDLRVEDDPNFSTEPDVSSEITLTGGAGEDFLIPAGTTMRFDCGSTASEDALQFFLNSDVTGDIDGTLIFQRTNSGSGPDHRISAVDPSAIDIEGSIVVENLGGGWEPFGESGSPGSVIFQSGAMYDGSAGGSPFGDSGQPAQTVFNSGSTYIHRGNHSFQTGGRTYANFEYRNPEIAAQMLAFGSSNNWTMEDFRILDGTLTLAGTNNLPFNINVSGDFEVGIDGTFNYAPTGTLPGSASTFNFNGSLPQTISVDGTLVFNDRITLELNNTFSSPGFALEIQDDLELFNDFLIFDGEVQGEGATITMSGSNTTLSVGDNGSIYGSDVGPGQDLSLVSNDPLLTLSGGTSSVCRFFNLTINNGLEFNVDRPLLEVQFGTFSIGENSTLRLNTAGEAILGSSVRPNYGINSQLIYNSGATTERGAEWSSTSGAGYPVNVTIQNGTTVEVTNSVGTDFGVQGDLNIGNASNGAGTLTMTDVTNFLQVGGDVNIGDGSANGSLTLSTQIGGDIRLRGDWNNAGTFNSNNRAVFFNGSTLQIINTTSVLVEVMDYLIIENSSLDGVILGGSFTELEVRGVPGNNALELYDGDLNLNGKSLYLGRNGNATGFIIGSEDIEIFSPIGLPATFSFEGNGNKVISTVGGGSLEFDNDVTVTISSGVDFGSSLTTINASLELLPGAFVNGNAPFYGPEGVLIYNTGLLGYSRRAEWNGTDGLPGFPNDVIIRSNTFISAAAISGFNNTPLELGRDLTIEENATLFMDFSGNGMEVPLVIGRNLILDGTLQGSDRTGGDIEISGDWIQAGTGDYIPNQRQVAFTGADSLQEFSAVGGEIFDFVLMDNPSGLRLNDNLRVARNLNFLNGVILPESSQTLTFSDNATVQNASNASYFDGVVFKEGDDDFTFPVGDSLVVFNDVTMQDEAFSIYQPFEIFDLPSVETFSVRYFAEESPNAGAYYDGQSNNPFDFQEISNCEYWFFDQITGSVDPMDIDDPRIAARHTNPNPEHCNDVVIPTNVSLVSWNSAAWSLIGSAPSGDFIASDFPITGPVVGGNYGEITFTSNNQLNVLPIELLFFNAQAQSQTVLTNWATASEINNDFFTIERSQDAVNFEEVGTVNGAGNSISELNYSFVDDAPYSGISYYRLKQTDFDGTFTYSDIRSVELRSDDTFSLNQVYRAEEGLRLNYKSDVGFLTIEIYDLAGKVVHRQSIENQGTALIYPAIARGVYLLRLSNRIQMDSKKFFY